MREEPPTIKLSTRLALDFESRTTSLSFVYDAKAAEYVRITTSVNTLTNLLRVPIDAFIHTGRPIRPSERCAI